MAAGRQRSTRRGATVSIAGRWRWRWLAGCALAAVPSLLIVGTTDRGTTDTLADIAVFGLAVGGAQALALTGPWPRRVLWAVLTAVGVWAAFPAGLMAGVATVFGFGWFVSVLPHGGQLLSRPEPILLGFAAGGLAGGALVGMFQAGLVRDTRRWIVRSAIGGVILLPTTLSVFYFRSRIDQAPLPQLAAIALVTGAVYALLTVNDVPAPSSGGERAEPSSAQVLGVIRDP